MQRDFKKDSTFLLSFHEAYFIVKIIMSFIDTADRCIERRLYTVPTRANMGLGFCSFRDKTGE